MRCKKSDAVLSDVTSTRPAIVTGAWKQHTVVRLMMLVVAGMLSCNTAVNKTEVLQIFNKKKNGRILEEVQNPLSLER